MISSQAFTSFQERLWQQWTGEGDWGERDEGWHKHSCGAEAGGERDGPGTGGRGEVKAGGVHAGSSTFVLMLLYFIVPVFISL